MKRKPRAENLKKRKTTVRSESEHERILQIQALKDNTRGMPCRPKGDNNSLMNMNEINFRERKVESLMNLEGREMSLSEKKDMLFCSYLRLTPTTVETLLEDLGLPKDTVHPHLSDLEMTKKEVKLFE